jgi:hypothetical protein
MQRELSSLSLVGEGCAGLAGPSTMTIDPDFSPGGTLRVNFETPGRQSPMVLLMGWASGRWMGMPLPLDLGQFCYLHISPDLIYGALGVGQSSIDILLPTDTYLLEQHVYVQGVIPDLVFSVTDAYDINLKVR